MAVSPKGETAESFGFCASDHPLRSPFSDGLFVVLLSSPPHNCKSLHLTCLTFYLQAPIFARAALQHKQKLQGSDFCSGKWDFPAQKSAPVSDAQVAGDDFDARGLRPSRALPWWGQAAMADVGLSSLALPGADQCAPIIAHFGSNEKRFRRI